VVFSDPAAAATDIAAAEADVFAGGDIITAPSAALDITVCIFPF